MESINFRNQQLAKRVEILQEDFEKSKLREGSGKKSGHHENLKDQSNLMFLLFKYWTLKISITSQPFTLLPIWFFLNPNR